MRKLPKIVVCPQCGERFIRGKLPQKNRKYKERRIKCPLCSEYVFLSDIKFFCILDYNTGRVAKVSSEEYSVLLKPNNGLELVVE